LSRLHPAFLVVAVLLSDASNVGAQTTEELRRVVLSKTQFGVIQARLPTPIDDVPGHMLMQTHRIDNVTSSDPGFFNGVREHVYIQSETFGDGSRRYNRGYSFFETPEGDRVLTRWDGVRAAPVNGVVQLESGNVEIIGGTGRFTKARGNGFWRQMPPGSQVIEEYVLNLAY
jgi:hypothetical protein